MEVMLLALWLLHALSHAVRSLFIPFCHSILSLASIPSLAAPCFLSDCVCQGGSGCPWRWADQVIRGGAMWDWWADVMEELPRDKNRTGCTSSCAAVCHLSPSPPVVLYPPPRVRYAPFPLHPPVTFTAPIHH
eukprot:superscaffoldBa00005904_g20922